MKKRITAILFAVLSSLTLCAVTMPLEDFSDLSAWKSDSYTPNTKFEKTADRPGITIHAPGGIYRMLPAKFGQYRNQGRNFNGISFKVRGDGSGNFGTSASGSAGDGVCPGISRLKTRNGPNIRSHGRT